MQSKDVTKQSVLQELKRGLISVDDAVEAIAPSPFARLGSVPLDNLRIDVIPSGFPTLDRNFFLKKGRAQLITVAAYTSHGKSAFLMQLAKNVSSQGPVFAIALEMGSEELTVRMLAAETGFSTTSIMTGAASLEKLSQKNNELLKSRQLYLNTDPDSDIAHIQRVCFEQAKRVGNPSLIVVDHIQLVDSTVDKEAKAYMYGHIMKKLRSLAYHLKCPVVTASQLNRHNEQRGRASQGENGYGDYRPLLSDIADSSGIAHNSDVVLFIIRPEQYEGTRKGEANFYCYKNRGGSCFETTMKWDGATTSFREY